VTEKTDAQLSTIGGKLGGPKVAARRLVFLAYRAIRRETALPKPPSACHLSRQRVNLKDVTKRK